MIGAAPRGDIHCPVGLFHQQEGRVAQLTDQINQAPTASEKAGPAQALAEEMDVLLECEAYDGASTDCRLCRGLAELRSKTAALVVKAGALDARRR